MKTTHVHLADIQGCSQLVVQATLGVTDLVQAMHQTILRQPLPLGKGSTQAPKGLHGVIYRVLAGTSGFVYDAVRGITKRVGSGIDTALTHLQPELIELESSRRRDALISVLNGVLGDHMKAHHNPLTIPMSLRHGDQVLELSRDSLAEAIAQPSGKVLLLLHGHCMNELQWCRHGHDHGEELAAANGFTPVYLRYNSGLHISENGRALADVLEQLVHEWPVPVQELCIVGYSMGGLVARSAFHYGAKARHGWLGRVNKLFFLGTPHHGSMLEQAGNLVDKALEISPYSHALSRLGKIRSAGTTDLRHGNLVQEDWSGRNRFAHFADQRAISQLPQGVKCYAIAAMISSKPSELRGKLVGDGLVPVKSALGQHRNSARALNIPPERQHVFYGMNHLGLLDSQAVYAQLQQWMTPPSVPRLALAP
ncbi:MAG: GPI inositol-deacylase [Gammaproteobacteria bacterium]|uniref:PGAP1-like alpha/beta domain-containing protein n=1 Tax=Rhodoferax sp. TaxID=50421 RepID=UPI0018242B23|nr:alpha/beta hydrolase [Rhodoferax sp.]MBU3900537.1 GPI inositol-deacylase [Gammaproteobacteria bacterium]MBA3057558.1 alpha/beta hydrolase [Rhodoferax sp.]MBU3996442.1 GPI inositol-deacylase [Gammaproteobacteria bacterium]MBU4079982.1 GPI inositol-deacylase [Gammaproteobacteria bacterium]MBU4113438.1 GPI inositol-deacylase [Gammaproteobacteria bacterium]